MQPLPDLARRTKCARLGPELPAISWHFCCFLGAESMAKQLMAEQSRVALLLAAVRRRQRQAVESRVADLRLSSQKFWLLEALEQQDGCTLAQLLGSLAMDQPTASRVLAELRSRGLVHVAMDSRDRRRRQLKLTAEGARVARRCSAVAQRVRKAGQPGRAPRTNAAQPGRARCQRTGKADKSDG
jgi:DNA-binding MarR family transcriptional regulator